MTELWSHRVGKHCYWCPTHVTPTGFGEVLVYVQRDTAASRACAWGAARLVRYSIGEREIVDWPADWSLPMTSHTFTVLCPFGGSGAA